MGFYKDNTVGVKFNGKSSRVGKQVAETLKKNGKLDGGKNSRFDKDSKLKKTVTE